MKILVWHNKWGNVYCQADTEEKELDAYYYFFRQMDDLDFYHDLANRVSNDGQKELYNQAKIGDAKAAKALLSFRSDSGYEYEEIEQELVVNPTEIYA